MKEMGQVHEEAQSQREQAEVSPVCPSQTLGTQPGHCIAQQAQADPQMHPFLPGPRDTAPSILAPLSLNFLQRMSRAPAGRGHGLNGKERPGEPKLAAGWGLQEPVPTPQQQARPERGQRGGPGATGEPAAEEGRSQPCDPASPMDTQPRLSVHLRCTWQNELQDMCVRPLGAGSLERCV